MESFLTMVHRNLAIQPFHSQHVPQGLNFKAEVNKIHRFIETQFSNNVSIKRGDVAQWVARLTRDRWIPVSREFKPIKVPHCFLEQETLL